MENKVLNENITHIAKYNKKLSSEILRFNCEKSTPKLVNMENGEFNLLLDDVFIHDINGAENEAKRIVNSIKNKEEKNIIRIIYGLGLGYLIDEAANNLEGKIIVYEPDLNIIKFVLSLAKIDGLMKNNVFLCCDKDTLAEYVYSLADDKSEISITFLNYHKNLYLDDIKDVLYIAQKAQAQHIGNRETIYKKMPQALLNTFMNFEKVLKTPNILTLKDIYKGKTALCVSAGPSLAENIEIIKKNQDKFVIFALNPTIKLLNKHNIQPDFIVYIETVDNSAQFEYDIVKNSYLILEPYCSWAVYDLKTKGIFNYISKNTFLNSWVLDCLKTQSNVTTMGTVSYTALVSAFLMGFDEIILIGQDLAFKDGNCYSKGSHYENLKCVFKKDLNKYVIEPDNYEEFEKAATCSSIDKNLAKVNIKKYLEFLNKNIATIKAQDGSMLPTQSGYAIFVDVFRKLGKELKNLKPSLKLINSSTGGAQIDNFENIKLEEIVKNLDFVEKKNLDIKLPDIDKEYIKSKIPKMKENLSKYRNYLAKIYLIVEKLSDELNKKLEFNETIIKLLKQLNETLKESQFLPKEEYFKMLTGSIDNALIGYFDENYLKTPKKCLEKNTLVLRYLKVMLGAFDMSIKKLTDCELVFLQ